MVFSHSFWTVYFSFKVAMEKKFCFSLLDSGFKLSSEQTECLMKWGLDRSLNRYKFSFDQSMQLYEIENFFKCLFNDQNVAATLGISGLGEVDQVKFEKVTCNYTTLDLFNVLKEGSLAPVRSDGTINGCFPDKFREVNCETELHMALLNEDSDQFCIFSDENRREFLFLIFQCLVIGGSLCQYENNVQPYLDMTRSLYKNLVNVYKNKTESKLAVSSSVFEVKEVLGKDGESFYPSASWKEEHVQTFCYAVVDAEKRHVTLLTNKYVPFW